MKTLEGHASKALRTADSEHVDRRNARESQDKGMEVQSWVDEHMRGQGKKMGFIAMSVIVIWVVRTLQVSCS